ncbi:MAG: 4-hydroxy-tetrahydrodipicolinate synthase [Ignavibacteriaceae bacterium]
MFKGTGTALITPFNEDLSIDYKSLKLLIDDQVNNGITAIIILGTTGETPVITEEERRKLVDESVSIANGRVKIIIGTGTNDTMKVVKYNKIAEEYNADGLLIVNPYYNKSTQAGLIEHYKYISDRTSLPIILYNVPSRTSMNMLPETVLKIHSECKNVVAVKEASGDISQIAKLCAMKPESLSVLSGNDDQTLPIMSLGGDGVVSVFSNIFPKEMSELTNLILKDDFRSALKLHNKYLKMMNLLFIETSPIPVKYLASVRGLCKNILRLPLVNATQQAEKLLLGENRKFEEL